MITTRHDDENGAIVTRQDDESGAIVNRVAASPIVTLDLASLLDAPPVVPFDLAPHLYRGLVLRERDFRASLAALDLEAYAGRDVAVFCSADALIPTWAYLLAAARLAPVAASVAAAAPAEADRSRWAAALGAHDWTAYAGKPVVVKGCGTDRVPLDAFVQATRHLQGVAAKVMYGEPCSSVPIWRRPAATAPDAQGPSASATPVVEARPAVRPAPLGPVMRALLLGLALASAAGAQPVPDAARPQPARLNAAVEAFVAGLWELDAVSALPRASEELVFARVAFDGREMTITTVYLDPDDGDLAGRSRRDRVTVSDGQLLVRGGARVRLFDVTPDAQDADRMFLHDVQASVTMALRRVDPAVLHDPGLVGTWHVAPPAHREAITITFGPDGRASGTSGDEAFDVDYVVAGAYVIVDNRDTFRYTVQGGELVLERGDERIALARMPR